MPSNRYRPRAHARILPWPRPPAPPRAEVSGWTARVNGHPAAIGTTRLEALTVRYGGIFQAVALPAGASDIVWRYVPLHANAIAAIFIAGMLALIAFVVRTLGTEPKRHWE